MDVFGKALTDFYKNGKADVLWLYNSYDEPEEMPVAIFFRTAEEMPQLEHKALSLCKGTILDVGAGVGSHALILQAKGLEVTAIDISKSAVEIMKKRGVINAFEKDFLNESGKYDTLLFLMNGIGLTGTIAGFTHFLDFAKTRINAGGQLIFDSSDISYLYTDLPKPQDYYFGEISYCYTYKTAKGKWFHWLYLDQATLMHIAQQKGWHCEIMFNDGEDQFLARLSLKD